MVFFFQLQNSVRGERNKRRVVSKRQIGSFQETKLNYKTNPAIFHRSKKREPCIKIQDSTTKPPPPPDTTQKKRAPDGRTCSPSPTRAPNLPCAEYKRQSSSEGNGKKDCSFQGEPETKLENVSCFPES